jgi:Fe-Mn family superoxide dismutase
MYSKLLSARNALNFGSNINKGKIGRRFLSAAKLPDLPYDFGALEPVISAEIMQIHHGKHHNAYVTNLNLSLTKLEEATAKKDTSGIISLQQVYSTPLILHFCKR